MKYYRFELTPNVFGDIEEYLVVSDDAQSDVSNEIEEDPEGFFHELVGDRYPGYELSAFEEISASEIPAGEHPFEIS